jgi:uncharacterized glyoxalase superfamily protein PhnB
VPPSACACCGESDVDRTVRLHSRPEISICFRCLDWLESRREAKRAAVDPVRIVQVDPIFAVSDVARSKDHYEKLGFSTSEHDATYAFAHRGDLTLHLAHVDDPSTRPVGSIYLHVDDADALAEAWRLAGTEVLGPEDTEYGKREGSHRDPDGNLVRFGSPIRTTADS